MVSPSQPGVRPGLLRRTWVRVFGESDPIERQLNATAKEGALLARVAHLCAFLMLLLFSLGSLVALAGDSVQAIASGHVTLPAIIAAGVSTLLVACMDTAMIYAASILRLLAVRHADKAEGRLHRWVLGVVAILEAGTYGYMSFRYETPHDGVAWALIGARALAAPMLSVYLSLARPLPVMARDMLALAERISGEGVLRDLARIAGDTSAPLADKVALYIASAVIAPGDGARLDALLQVAQRRVASSAATRIGGMQMPDATALLVGATPAPSQRKIAQDEPSLAIMEASGDEPSPDRPPTGPGSPVRKRRNARGLNPATEAVSTADSNVVEMPHRRRRKSAPKRAARGSAEPAARAVFTPGMSAGELMRLADISKGAASKWRGILQAEVDAVAASQAEQAAQ